VRNNNKTVELVAHLKGFLVIRREACKVYPAIFSRQGVDA